MFDAKSLYSSYLKHSVGSYDNAINVWSMLQNLTIKTKVHANNLKFASKKTFCSSCRFYLRSDHKDHASQTGIELKPHDHLGESPTIAETLSRCILALPQKPKVLHCSYGPLELCTLSTLL